MKIKTKSGFACEINEKKVKDWRFIKALAKCDSKDESQQLEGITEIIPFLFGEKGEEKLIKHVSKDGIASTEDIIAEFREVLILAGEEAKKSQSSQA